MVLRTRATVTDLGITDAFLPNQSEERLKGLIRNRIQLIRSSPVPRCCGMPELWRKRVGILDCEPGLTNLLEVRCGEAGKLRSYVIDDVKVAVRPVVVPQPKIGAQGLIIRRIHLNDAAES